MISKIQNFALSVSLEMQMTTVLHILRITPAILGRFSTKNLAEETLLFL